MALFVSFMDNAFIYYLLWIFPQLCVKESSLDFGYVFLVSFILCSS